MCHHSTFLVYGSLKHPSEERWKRLTHTSVAISTLIEILFAVFGYATFTGYVQGRWPVCEHPCGPHLATDSSLTRLVSAAGGRISSS